MNKQEKKVLHQLATAQMLIGICRFVLGTCATTQDKRTLAENKKAFGFVFDTLDDVLRTLYQTGVFNKQTEALLDQCFAEYGASLNEEPDKEKGGAK